MTHVNSMPVTSATFLASHVHIQRSKQVAPDCSFQPSYNLPPGRDAPVVKRAEDGQLEVQTMRCVDDIA